VTWKELKKLGYSRYLDLLAPSLMIDAPNRLSRRGQQVSEREGEGEQRKCRGERRNVEMFVGSEVCGYTSYVTSCRLTGVN
jgi:hypothetical protein